MSDTAPIISLAAAKQDKLFYFLANVVVYRESDKRCLILQRASTEKVHPGKYGVVGGKLEWKDLPPETPSRIQNGVLDYLDAVEDLLAREAMEEANVTIGRNLRYINSVAYIRPDGIPAILVKFAATYEGGEIVVEKGAFDGFAWVTAEECAQYSCIDGIQEEVAKTIALFAEQKNKVNV